MIENQNCFIMGEPNAGKSTFLAALWHSITQKLIKTKLTLNQFVGNGNYLQGLNLKWLQIEDLDRTLTGYEKEELRIQLAKGDANFDLVFPDLSGETFMTIYDSRRIKENVADMIRQADVILYFVNVRDIKEAEFIAELPDILRKTEPAEKTKTRDAVRDDPTQVKIIELLQIVMKLREYKKVKLGLILSAWDLVDDNVKPDDYLKLRMNMLWQYLQSNKSLFSTRLWGVSALGGKIEEVEKLVSIENPIDRIRVVDGNCETNDITTIIYEMVGAE